MLFELVTFILPDFVVNFPFRFYQLKYAYLQEAVWMRTASLFLLFGISLFS